MTLEGFYLNSTEQAYNIPIIVYKRCYLDTPGKDTSKEGNKD